MKRAIIRLPGNKHKKSNSTKHSVRTRKTRRYLSVTILKMSTVLQCIKIDQYRVPPFKVKVNKNILRFRQKLISTPPPLLFIFLFVKNSHIHVFDRDDRLYIVTWILFSLQILNIVISWTVERVEISHTVLRLHNFVSYYVKSLISVGTFRGI